ncbi:hypothetical protein [Thermaerobacillus caldiproteolyticus]|uniref:Uncharacterized protein n=1 Tax=Thermaerobacillus caldiproteolyticus TaxID=247480 RepID=A0A7V9ZA69_9BACL|nr:hypothetical protein [Anoxybacillus caldiproteolyticus]MBA2876917.1 hypothetical protein [Anoxybacillus caldiproteolyticus]
MKEIKEFFKGTSFPEQALFYYTRMLFEIFPKKIKVRNRDKLITGSEFDVVIIFNNVKKPYVLLLEYDGAGWHKDIEEDIEKNNLAVKLSYPFCRVREKACPKLKDERIYSIIRGSYSSRDYDDLNRCIVKAIDWIIAQLKSSNVLSKSEFRRLLIHSFEVKKSVDTLYDMEIISELIKNVVYHQKMQEIEYKKAQLIDTAKKNMEYFTSVRNWDEFADKNNLSKSHMYIYYFGSWSKALEVVGQKNIEEIKRKMAIEQGYETIDFVKSYATYKKYLEELNREDFMSARAIVKLFGSWNNFKKELGLDTYTYQESYSTNYLIELMLKYKDLFKNSSKWNKFAKENKLPNAHVYIRRFGSMDKAKEIAGISKQDRNTHKRWTTDELITVACQFKEHFTTMEKWGSFHKKMKTTNAQILIPFPSIYQKRFGGWENAKKIIFGER